MGYTITDLECFGIVWGVRKNAQFVGQNKFTIITDHKALETLRKHELLMIARRTRWILELEQYNFQVIHRYGRKIAHVNALSRNFQEDQETPTISDSLRVSFEEEPIKVEEKRDDYITLIDPFGLATLP